MTTIGTSLPSVSLNRDPSGAIDQPGMSDDAFKGSDGRNGSFATLLAKMSQSPENEAATSPASGDAAASGSLKTPAGESSAANVSEAAAGHGSEPANFEASLAGLGTTSKSGTLTNRAAPQAGANVNQPALTSLKSAADQVTGLLGRVVQNTASASASAAQHASSPKSPAGVATDDNASESVSAAEQARVTPMPSAADAQPSSPSQVTEKVTEKTAGEVTEKSTANNNPASNSPLANGFSLVAAATAFATSNTAPTKRQATQQPATGAASGGSTRRVRNAADEGVAASPVSDAAPAASISGAQPIATIVPIAGAPAASNAKANASIDAVVSTASGADRSSPANALAQVNDPALSLSNTLDATAPTVPPDAATTSGSVEIKVTALSTATHFAPVARLSPVQQISDALAASIPSLSGGRNGAGAASAAGPGSNAGSSFQAAADSLSQAAQSSGGAIKTLNLELQPETLGQVTIKLSMSDNGLAVQLEAAHQQTADLLDKDRQALTQKLTQAGYTIASVEVSGTPHASHLSGDTPSQQGQADANAGRSGGQASSFGGSPNGERQAHDSAAFAETSRSASNIAANDGSAAQPRTGGSGELFI
jgi:Flagellar hook-length control protein FliK